MQGVKASLLGLIDAGYCSPLLISTFLPCAAGYRTFPPEEEGRHGNWVQLFFVVTLSFREPSFSFMIWMCSACYSPQSTRELSKNWRRIAEGRRLLGCWCTQMARSHGLHLALQLKRQPSRFSWACPGYKTKTTCLASADANQLGNLVKDNFAQLPAFSKLTNSEGYSYNWGPALLFCSRLPHALQMCRSWQLAWSGCLGVLGIEAPKEP